MSRRIFIIFVASCVLSSLQAIENVGTSAFTFLKVDVGGRAAAMAGAFSAVADDPSALFYNPAGLVQIPKPDALFSHTKWVLDTDLNFVGVVVPMGRYGAFGGYYYGFNSGDIKETTIYQPEGTGRYFQVNSYLLSLGYAKRMTDHLSIGGSVKWVREEILHESAGAFAFDFGSLFETDFLNTKLALVLSNFGGFAQFEGRDLLVDVYGGEAYLRTYKWNLPLFVRIGVASDFAISKIKGVFAAEMVDARDAPPHGNIGLELNLLGHIALRGGYRIGYDEDKFTAGMGIKFDAPGLGTLAFDYAYHDIGMLGTANRLSLNIKFR